MKVKAISNAAELERVSPFRVECLLWGTKEIPKTYGYLGFVPGDGFYLKMVCEEKEPLRKYMKDFDPVYRDSAMEAFFQFDTRKGNEGVPIYMNFEANANGALLAAYGSERMYRSHFSKEEVEVFGCRAKIEEEFWSVSLRIPLKVLYRVYGPLNLDVGSKFTCNFYKISETKAVEHYASCFPIRSDIPSFHMPEFFGGAEIVR